jgi:hypothetical protein
LLPDSKEIAVISKLTRLQKWLGLQSSGAAAGRKPARLRPHLEALEDRLVPATMSDIPFVPPSGPTTLALNFDGCPNATAQPDYRVSAYTSGNALQTDQNIQDILFRTSEIYAPFNVEVTRLSGANNFLNGSGGGGPTTIFVGNSIGGAPVGAGVTPSAYGDYPTSGNPGRLRNGDPFDLAFVDPAGNVGKVTDTSAAIAHEAGHTFGLTHVRTDGVSYANDSTGLLSSSSMPDVMTYNRGLGLAYFADKALPVSAWNYTSKGYVWSPNLYPFYADNNVAVQPTSQDSLACLSQVLGTRSQGSQHHVADVGAVDPNLSGMIPKSDSLVPDDTGNMVAAGTLDRLGDYDVYRWTAPYTQTIQFHLQGSNGLTPDLLVYDSSGGVFTNAAGNINDAGNQLLYLQDSLGARQGGVAVQPGSLQVQAGQVLYFVVGAQDAQSTGDYYLSIREQTHTFYVTQTNLHANVPNVPGTWAPVWATASYYVNGDPAPRSVATPANQGKVQIDVDVTQQTQSVVLYQGSVQDVNGHWVVHFSTGQNEPLIIQGGHWVTHAPNGTLLDTGYPADTDPGQFFKGIFTVYVGAPTGTQLGTRNIHLTYDLAAQTITGSTSDGVAVSGLPGQVITVPGGPNGYADVSFTVSMDYASYGTVSYGALAGLLGNIVIPLPGSSGPGASSQYQMSNVVINPASSPFGNFALVQPSAGALGSTPVSAPPASAPSSGAARIDPQPAHDPALVLSRHGGSQTARASGLALDLVFADALDLLPDLTS